MQPRCRVGVVLACAAALLLAAAGARAQCEGRWLPVDPLDGLGTPDGLGGSVAASVAWDPDGGGPQPAVLVAAGDFGYADCGPVNNIATWDGERWQRIGNGLPSVAVRALTVFNGDLIATGWYPSQTGGPGSRTWRWSPPDWVPLGSGEPEAYALAVHQGQLYAGGDGVRRWTGATWQTLTQGPNNTVLALASFRGELFAGGRFTVAGGNLASGLAAWNGSTWHALPSQLSGSPMLGFGGPHVHTLLPEGDDLLAGGTFARAGDMDSLGAARWTGSAWLPLGGGVTNAFTMFRGDLIAVGTSYTYTQGGRYLVAGRRLHGGVWETIVPSYDMGLPVGGTLQCATVVNDSLFVGGEYLRLDGVTAQNIARWDGATSGGWHALGGPSQPRISGRGLATTQFRGELVVGGDFYLSLSPSSPLSWNIARWNGRAWSGFGAGLNNYVRALTEFNGDLIAGGDFNGRVARWDGVNWMSLGGGLQSSVRAFAQLNGFLYAAGGFGASAVARWNGATWVNLENQSGGTAFDMVVYNGNIVVGGDFFSFTPGCTACTRIARWNPVTRLWSPLGSGVNGTVYSLAVQGDDLIVGGVFSLAGGATVANAARWSDTTNTWQPLGSLGTVTSNSTNDFEVYDGRLYAGGDFSFLGGVPFNGLARWNAAAPSGGAWEPMGMVGTSTVAHLAPFRGEMIATGALAGSTWLRYTTTNSPWLAIQPVGQPGVCGGLAVFTTAAATGYESAGFQWRRNGYNLVDGPTPSGSVISGSQTATLTIANTTWYDAADYTCLLYNSCGSDLSRPATLSLCRVDVDCNARVEPADLSAFINIWFGALTSGSPLGDFDQDSAVTAADLSAFVNAWFAAVGGTCP